jgi:hypothetical protein
MIEKKTWREFWASVAVGKAEDWECMWVRGDTWLPVMSRLSQLYVYPREYKIRRKRKMVTVTIPQPLKEMPANGEVWTFGWTGPVQPSFPKKVIASGRGYATEEEAQMAADAFRPLVECEK